MGRHWRPGASMGIEVMSKRVTLTNREISHIVAALKKLQEEPGVNYQVTLAGKAAYQDIIDKLTPPGAGSGGDAN